MSLITPVGLSTTYTGAVAREASESPSRKRPLEEETFQPKFDVSLVSEMIQIELKDSPEPGCEKRIAEALCMMQPELMMDFSVYRPTVVDQFFKDYLLTSAYEIGVQTSICSTIKHLCAISLLNSKYQDTIVELDDKIVPCLEASTKECFQDTIELAKALIQAPIIKNFSALEDESIKLNQMQERVGQALDLFFYVNDGSMERIGLLASETILADGAPRYPNCHRYFGRLCQNLQLLSNERVSLIQLQTQIREKLNNLRLETKLLYETQELKQPSVACVEMIPARERFVNAELPLLWNEGGKLLSKAFVATLEYKKAHKHWSIPRTFASSINQSASMNSQWENLRMDIIFPKKGVSTLPDFDVGYVGNVWGNYTKEIDHLTDLGGFMRHFINALPEKWFKKLSTATDKPKALDQAFTNFFGKDATFITLKQWALKLKPLRD